jgi:enoyl-CoA hydratase/carnithine racemase
MEWGMADVETRFHDGWAEVVLNRPERKNAITGPLGIALAQAMAEVDGNDDVRVVVLRGAEGAFCSGLDLKEFNAEPAPAWLAEFQTIWRGAHRSLFECSKPIVGALERYAINGGAALALACDLLIAGDGAFLQVGEVQIGMAAPYNLAWLSLRHPESTISQVAMIGDRLHGPDLTRLGIANQSVPDAEVASAAEALATKMAGFPPGGLRRIKAGTRARLDVGADAWFDRFTGKDPVSTRPKPKRVS